ncbi:MAG TPA: DUF1549 and DUF1553 domain-containing protein [Planctomycetaceae bacterium]|jgi:hypothetical protein|nr:DUF1549 and DUF1553 domain-containing protein [Planctomycetaceae bacterium]
MPAQHRFLMAGLFLACAIGTARSADSDPRNHWSFRPLVRPAVPTLKNQALTRTPVDAFLLAPLEEKGLGFSPEADRATLLRRLSFDLTGLPPQPEETAQFVADPSAQAYSRAVERLLASPHYGERWGKYWLDVAGYADSNGYFNADTDRPLAYKYRDHVIRSFNRDQPFDQFIREQLAGDELSGHVPGKPFTREVVEQFTATHFLRNSQDGSGESDGNADEVRIDRATVLQGTLQISMNSLLGVTIQCCRCHEHKFEPIAAAEYYQLQSIFYPAFPAYDLAHWVKPKDRIREMPEGDEGRVWKNHERQIDDEKTRAVKEYISWINSHRPSEAVLFRDEFQHPGHLHEGWWSPTPEAGQPDAIGSVALDSPRVPAARVENGTLKIQESNTGDRWLVTRQIFNWQPPGEGEWTEASFNLVADRIDGSPPAERIAFFIAAQTGDSKGARPSAGNLVIDGNPAGKAALHLAYASPYSRPVGEIGESGYRPGHRYGIRVTNVSNRKLRLEQIVDHLPEKNAITLDAVDLPEGAFGFEYCCGRSFVVSDVLVETSGSTKGASTSPRLTAYRTDAERHTRRLHKTLESLESQRLAKPGELACVTDVVQSPPALHVLKRGNYTDLGEPVVPAGLRVLSDGSPDLRVTVPYPGSTSSGRRLAFARWLTASGSRPASLLARVMANRIWQRHFGTGIVVTPDNFGLSGTRPTHPKLLEFLAHEFVGSGWSVKQLHRLIVNSAAYRQSSAATGRAVTVDLDNRWLSRFPLRRLDAEAVRDSMLSVSGEITERMYGPYVRSNTDEEGAVVVLEDQEGAHRRSIYLQQRRTQVNSLLDLFDAPTIVSNCPVRGTSTVPLQSLALLNSSFVRARAVALASAAIQNPASRSSLSGDDRISRAIERTFGRGPTASERAASSQFVEKQSATYGAKDDPAWRDFCQMLLASNAFLYVE